jgi:N6-adenosine-specific RNA methylase IME4
MYTTLVADPPWQFGDKLPGDGRGAAKNYSTLSLEDIKNFLLPDLAPDCRLFLWRVASMQEEALAVMKAWGFTLKTEIVWQKLTANGLPWFGMGRTVRASHETCLIGVRGRPPVLNRSIRSTFSAPYTRHSGKPEEFFDLVEQLSPGPYVELFARRSRPGWTCLGDEVESSVDKYSVVA